MSFQIRTLTKSRFVLGMECPTKLFYTRKPDYPDRNADNDFLRALAEGGFQVGALAQALWPEGILVEEQNTEAAWHKTNELLGREKVVLFEAALRHETILSAPTSW